MADSGKSRSQKDKEMAARLKREGDERWTGRCCICYRIISNGAPCEAHYNKHARGADAD
jgi:hypothetical protein